MNEIEIRTACEQTIQSLLRESIDFEQDPKTFCTTDFVYRLTGLSSEVCVGVDVRRRVRPAEVTHFVAVDKAAACSRRMIFAEHLTANVGSLLQARGFWYADAQGNAFVEVPGELLVHVAGKRPQRSTTPRGQHFSAPGAKVLHYLLNHGPRIEATYRKIRAATGVSIDKIGKLVRELEQGGTVRVHGNGDYEILDGKRIIRLWSEAYEDKLAPALDLGRYAEPGHNFDRLVGTASDVLKGEIIIGGEVAADVYIGHLRPGTLRLYIPRERAEEVRRLLRLAPSESGLVELCELYSPAIGGRRKFQETLIADPTFVYGELMAEDDDRLAETAVRLRQEHLAWTL